MPWCDAQRRFPSPYYDAVRDNVTAFSGKAWPTLAVLNALSKDYQLVNHRGQPIQFIAPADDESTPIHYEKRIAETLKSRRWRND